MPTDCTGESAGIVRHRPPRRDLRWGESVDLKTPVDAYAKAFVGTLQAMESALTRWNSASPSTAPT